MTAVRRQDSGVSVRRGAISLWTAGVLGLCGFAGFCVISIRLDSARLQHARYAAESAAIAAAHAWLTDDLLRASQAAFEVEGRTIRSREAADAALSGYRTAGAPLIPRPEDPECFWSTGSGVESRPFSVPVAVRVTIPEVIPATSPGLARLLTGQSLSVASTAAIESHPAALCPAPDSSIAFLPFAAIEDALGSWSQLIDLQTGTDVWSWNPQNRQFDSGPDGIPEITVTLDTDAASGSGPRLLGLNMRAAAETGIPVPTHAEIIRSGLTRQCLDGLGLAELRYPSSFEGTTLSGPELSECLGAIAETPYEPRILSLATPVAAVAAESPAESPAVASAATPVQLVRPVAVRVADLAQTSASSATLVLQPCVLVSALIRTDRTVPASRCVYSVRLVE